MSSLLLIRGIKAGFGKVPSEPVRPGLWSWCGRGQPGTESEHRGGDLGVHTEFTLPEAWVQQGWEKVAFRDVCHPALTLAWKVGKDPTCSVTSGLNQV